MRITDRFLPLSGLTVALLATGAAIATAALLLGGIFLFRDAAPVASAPESGGVTRVPPIKGPKAQQSRASTTIPQSTTSSTSSTTIAPSPPPPPPPPGTVVTRVIDGDTIDVAGGTRIRLIGIDSPEVGQCGYTEARNALAAMVAGRTVTLVPGARDDADRYGRLLRYVEIDGLDTNLAMIQQGHAIARFDSLDGYGRHPRQDTYRTTDANSPAWGNCSGSPGSSPPAAPNYFAPPQDGGAGDGCATYYANCTEARRAGVTPIYLGQPGYRPALDRDGDGIACE